MPQKSSSPVRHLVFIGAFASLALLAACGGVVPRSALVQQEDFGSADTHSRSFSTTTAQTCEAARRALLSQGYVINTATNELVNGRKNFQPENEVHVEVEFRVVCASEGKGGKTSLVFVSALQERYALKKSNNSASVGVGALGSLSLPFSSSDDALVKVSSETLSGERFYDRFFRLMERYLSPNAAAEPEAAASSAAAAASAPS